MITVTHNPYAVDVYKDGEFLGGITAERMAKRDNVYLVADALAEILKAAGLEARVLSEDALAREAKR